MNKRVVITGMGALTPLAIGVEPAWQALCQGKSGIGLVTRFDTTNFRSKIAGEVKGFNADDFIPRKVARSMDVFILYALAAARMAMEDSKLSITDDNAERIGVSVGTSLAGVPLMEKNHRLLLDGAQRSISPFFVPGFIANMASGQIAILFGARGGNFCSVTACAAGTHSIGEAFKVIQRGDAQAMIAGGTEAAITPLLLAGLDALKATSPRNDAPQRASRPFDKDRDGFVPAEGAGIVILEELESALSRGAKIYAEVIGYGFSCDAYHITSTSPTGQGAASCMRMALRDAGISPGDVDYINAHGTSTVVNDVSETLAVKAVFQEHSKEVPLSSNKSMLGHMWGASGAVEAIFSTLSICHGVMPPTINLEIPDPQCDLDYVPNVARKASIDIVMSNSFGFGGTNGSLVLKKFSS